MKLISLYMQVIVAITAITSCNEEDFATREHYKCVIYLLSEGSYNVYPVAYNLAYGDEVTKYFSVGCGGSLSNSEHFTIELEPDTLLLEKFNKGNFDIDEEKYAKILPESKYSIETYTVVFPAFNPDQYVKVGVQVSLTGLSPDSIYFIPLRIKSVSQYEINEEKSGMLFRVALENYYAEQLNNTYYQMRGSTINEAGEIIGTTSATKLVRPLTGNSIRFYAGSRIQTDKSPAEEIKTHSIIVTIDADNKISITPYGTIEVEQLEGGGYWNTYEEEKSYTAEKGITKYLYLYYRFRTLESPATATEPAVWSQWTILKETLRKLE